MDVGCPPASLPAIVLDCDGVWYFTSGSATRKSRNIAADDRCAIGAATQQFDLEIEGSAVRVTDRVGLHSVRIRHGGTFRCHQIRSRPMRVEPRDGLDR